MPLADAGLIAFLLNAAVQISVIYAGTALALGVVRTASAGAKHRIAVTGLTFGVLVPMLSAWAAEDPGSLPLITTVDARALAADRVVLVLSCGCFAVVVWKASALARAIMTMRSLRRTCTPIVDGPIAASFQRCAIDGRIQICRSRQAMTPLVLGWSNPIIVLPDALAARQPDVIDAVIAHECAHVERHDVAIAAAIEVLTAPFAFHPAIVALKRAAAHYRELACDERAIARLGMPHRTYAAALVRVAECGATPAGVGAGVVSHLEWRVRELLELRSNRVSLVSRGLALACLLSAIAIAPLCAIAIDGGWRDLSGIWALDVEHSEPRGRVPFQSARMRIATDGSRLLIAQERTRSNGRVETFEIRGTTNDVPFKVYLPGSAALQTRARWQGHHLITDAVGPGRRYREHGEAVADGDRLVIKTENAYDNARTRYQLVFRRQ